MFDVGEKIRAGRTKVNDARAFENALLSLFSQFVPERLRAKYQRDIALAFTIGVTNEASIAMMASSE